MRGKKKVWNGEVGDSKVYTGEQLRESYRKMQEFRHIWLLKKNWGRRSKNV